jgi:hypothetical protein
MITFLNKALGKWMKPTTDDGLPVNIVGTGLILPVDTQARATSTIVTHNAASIAANTSSIPSTWIDTQDPNNPFTECDITLLNDAARTHPLTFTGQTTGQPFTALIQVSSLLGPLNEETMTRIKSVRCAARWMKVVPTNLDTAAAHTMTVTVYSKA